MPEPPFHWYEAPPVVSTAFRRWWADRPARDCFAAAAMDIAHTEAAWQAFAAGFWAGERQSRGQLQQRLERLEALADLATDLAVRVQEDWRHGRHAATTADVAAQLIQTALTYGRQRQKDSAS